MFRTILPLLLLVALPLACQARQYSVRKGDKKYVAHTRMAPVVLHRALPPFKGQHVYAGRSEK
ncbi:MAG: hypothetical protein ACR2FY_03660 [Pirellulaceae bacterium]